MARIKFFQDIIYYLRGKSDKQLIKQYYDNKFIYLYEDSQDLIYNKLMSDAPCLIGRFGSTELNTVRQFVEYKNKKSRYNKTVRNNMATLSGFFPTDDYNLNKFSCEMISISKNIDILGCWFRNFEYYMCSNFMSESSRLVHLNSICPVTFARPWTKALKGKRVLVIHPFEDTIRKQYEKRAFLFSNPDILPEFELLTMKPVQGLADNKDGLQYKDWFEALDDMKSKINNIDFDIAIIGAGAYGLFLADYCKTLGKKAVHMGGATQLLFGIKGARWDDGLGLSLYNEYWVRPAESEKPKGAEKVEGACYW